MTFPPFVARAAARLAAGGLVAAAAIAVAALVIERTQLGGDLEASRARLRAEVVAEAPLPGSTGAPLSGAEFLLDTSIVPVSLRPQFEGAAESAGAFVIRSAGN